MTGPLKKNKTKHILSYSADFFLNYKKLTRLLYF